MAQYALALAYRVFDSQAEVWPRRLLVEGDAVWEECRIFLLNGECGDAVGESQSTPVVCN